MNPGLDERVLAGKHVLVTGGSRGLGRAFCIRFASAGARIAFTYARDAGAAEQTLAACRALSADGRAYHASVLDTSATSTMVEDLERSWGSLDILVNNAGVIQNLPLALLEEADWDSVLDVNLKGCFLTSRAVLPGMIRRRHGVILNVGSVAGIRMTEAAVHYTASKAALAGLTSAMAREVGRYAIRVVCLAPGLLDEGMAASLPPRRTNEYLEHCALGRLASLDEIAELATFLVSDRCSFMTGATVVIDGGI
ncbi:MAG: SDR family oxidoreductase [Pseudomonadota bacterium]